LIRIKRFAAQLLEARGIDYDLEIQDNLAQFKLPMQFRQHIYLIMKEAINNLVKYSQCSRAIIVVSYHHHELRVLISDNGIGFDTNNPRKGNGLLNMQHRANLMKAVLAIESAPEQGTTVELKVKIK
jgi:signal transduction histidine kinase